MAVTKITPAEAKAMMAEPNVKAAPQMEQPVEAPSGKFTWKTAPEVHTDPAAECGDTTVVHPITTGTIVHTAGDGTSTNVGAVAGGTVEVTIPPEAAKVGGFMASKMAAAHIGDEPADEPADETAPWSDPVPEAQYDPETPIDAGTLKKPSVTETTKLPGQPEQETSYPISDAELGPIAAHDLAHVSVNLGLTINMGDFNNAKVGVHITMPTSVDDLDGTFDFAKQWAEDRISAMADEVSKA